MAIDPVSALLKPGLDLVKAGLSAIRKQLGKRKADQMASAVIAELLKQSPDITAAEAQLAAIEATGAKPTPDPHRAKNMYMAVRSYKPAATKARWAARRGSVKKAASKRKPSARHPRPRAKRKALERPPRFVYDDADNVIATHEHKGDFHEF